MSAQSLFHLFRLEDQKTVARHLVGLTKPGSGAMIAGRQVGAIQAREEPGPVPGTAVFVHNPESWTRFWEEIGDETGSRWEVQAWEEEPPERVKRQVWYKPGVIILAFTLIRQE